MMIWKRAFWAALALICTVSAADPATPQPPFPGTDTSHLNLGDKEKNYRQRTFRAYLPVEVQEDTLKMAISSYLENPTGIFFNAGEKVTITVTGGNGQDLRLIVHDFDRADEKWYDITRRSPFGVQKTKINPLPTHTEYELQEGENELIICNRGLAYLHYRSLDPANAPEVQVSIRGGQINGIISRTDSQETCRSLLENAPYSFIDLIGDRIQLAFWAEGIRKGRPEKAAEVIAIYDRILTLIQDDLMGFDRYRRHLGGHILIRTIAEDFMCAGEMGVFFAKDTFPGVAEPEALLRESWGPAHELGHLHQTRPGLMWIGTVEVTNNIASIYVNYMLRPDHLRMEHSVTPNSLGEPMPGGIFDCFANNAIVSRRLWQFQGAALPKNQPKPWEDASRDVFTDVAPLWQLLLYNTFARGRDDFYPQIYENVRNTDESALSQGELRVLFCKRACDAAGLDLSDFFVKTGILAPIDRMVNDYEEAHMTITRDMCTEAVQYASRYPKPDSSVIYYITANSMPLFRDKTPVHAAPHFKPAIKNERMEVPADACPGAVAFEAYAGNRLLHISLLGLNHAKADATTVICPAGTDSVQAVQWDGKRVPILGAAVEPSNESTDAWLVRSNGIFSLHEAARAGHTETVQARLSGPIVKHNQYGWIVETKESTDDRSALINAPNEDGDTPLHLAVASGHQHIADMLLKAGADQNAKNKAGKTPKELEH